MAEEKPTIAVFGVSDNAEKYGYKIFTTLLRRGFAVYGINPKGGEVEGQRVYAKLSDVPGPVHTAIMVIPPMGLEGAVRQCVDKGVKLVYFQPGARSDEAYQLAVNCGLRAVESCYMADLGLW